MKRKKITKCMIWHSRRRARDKIKIMLKRQLKINEVVHHIDFNPLNNKNCNLLVCTSSYHQWLHQRLKVVGIISEHGEKIKELYLEGYSKNYLTSTFKLGKRTINKILRYFRIKNRTKNEAQIANLKTMKISGYYYHTDRFLIEKLKKISIEEEGRSLTGRRFNEKSNISSDTIRRHFGSWNNAKRLADIL